MPELPEVEIIVRYLRPKILGRKILGLEILSRRAVRDFKNPAELKNEVVGQKITGVERTGKYIVFKLSGGKYFLFHLMMTGKLFLNPQEKNKHDRLVLYLSGSKKLVFNDIRQFGKCMLVSPPSDVILRESSDRRISNNQILRFTQNDFVSKLGEDPLKISFKEFKDLISSRNKIIKNFLIDQKILAGIGNIYADEILWEAGIYPKRVVSTLKPIEISRLYKSIQKILRLAIKKEGTSSRDYQKPDGSKGDYYGIRKAYQRTGEKCSRCGGTIKRVIIGARSTHFCFKHQT